MTDHDHDPKGQSCLVCGKAGEGVSREIDQGAAWFLEILKNVIGEEFDQFQTFCNICDRLISEFEEISKEKRSLKQQIELRVSNNETSFEVIDYLNENDDDNESSNEIKIETGEITDVSSYMKSDVKIFEIDVKSEIPAEISASQQHKFHKKEKCNKSKDLLNTSPKCEKVKNAVEVLEVDQKTWENIFLVHELSSNWNILLTCLLQKLFPDCLIHLEDPNYKSDSNIFFSAKGNCQISSCSSKFTLRSSKNYEIKVHIEGQVNHEYPKAYGEEAENLLQLDNVRDKIYEMDETECEMARICQFCLKYFEEPQSFYAHRNLHLGDECPFLCLVCGKTFLTANLRNLHYLEGHGKYTCQKCKKNYTSEVKLNMHIKHCTFGQTLQCKICNKTFANKRNLRDHTKIFHEEQIKEESKYHFPCPECDKVFYKKSNLTSHMLRHSDVTPFICGVLNCGKGFKREKTLIKHFQLIHEGIKDEFLCVHCGQQFMSQTGLRTHIAIHTGQEYIKRNIKCDVCDKAFRCQADLKTHSVVHTKAKPYNCDWPQCGQSFSQKASLKDHLNVHEKKFQCDGCRKCFGRERYLMLHCKTCAHLSRTGENNLKGEPSYEMVGEQNDWELKREALRTVEEKDQNDGSNSIGVQHIIITTEGAELAGDISEDIEMTQVQVVQSESGELAVTMLVGEEGTEELQLVPEEGIIQVVKGEPSYEIVSGEKDWQFKRDALRIVEDNEENTIIS